MAPRLSARSRLTLVTLSLFVGLSVLLVTINYVIVSRTTASQFAMTSPVLGLQVGPAQGPAEEQQATNDLVACLRSHQIDMADPTLDEQGNLRIVPPGEDVQRSSAFTDAITACQPADGVGLFPSNLSPEIRAALQRLQTNPTTANRAELQRLGAELGQSLDRARASARTDLLQRLLLSSAIAVAVAGLAAWYVAGRVARSAMSPVHRITSIARKLSGEQLHERIALDGPDDELKELADTFDAMLARLETSFEARRSFSAYASHELRTPMASLRGEAELALADASMSPETRRLAQLAVTSVDRTDRLVGSLLTISRAESGIEHSTVVDVAALAGDVAGELVDIADRAQLDLHLDLGDGVVQGDPTLITSMLHNLLHNAILYNCDAGWISLSVASDTTDVVVAVENTGPELTDDDIATMSQPFQRLSRSRVPGSGHGLGTAIVAAVTRAHGGTAVWRQRPGGGVRAIVTFPLAS
jgi:signal transduction histidine kinase